MELRLADVQPILAEMGLPAVQAIAPMAGGHAPIFRLDLADGTRVVLKAYPAGASITSAEKDAYAASLVAPIDVPFTRYLRVDSSCERLPVPYILTSYLPGVTAQSMLDHPGIDTVYRQMGALLRRLHAVRLPAYGPFGATGIATPFESNPAFIRHLVTGGLDRFRHQGGDPALAEKLEALLLGDLDRIATHSAGAVFAHDDLHPNNVLVEATPDGGLALSGIIDFGNARAADAIFDLAKGMFCSEHDAPGSGASIRAGYGPLDHPEPEAALAYYITVHRITMWGWLRRTGFLPSADSPNDLVGPLEAAVAAA